MARAKTKSRPAKAIVKRGSRKSPSKRSVGAGKKEKQEKKISAGAPVVPSALVLPEALDSASAEGIKELLLTRRGSSLTVDAGQVRRAGIQTLQILIAAARTWQADGQSYIVTNPSPEFLDSLALVGLSREHLLVEGFSR
jgi:anti-anti-sigma regulatory factor